MAMISLLLLIQYILEYFQTSNDADRSLMKQFFYILGLRSFILFLSLLFPYKIGMWIALFGILSTWLLPGLLSDPNRGFVSADLSPENFSWESIAIFMTLTSLFMVYTVEVDHLLDVKREETGIRAIYSHYPILFGLSLITISLTFLGNSEIDIFYTTIYFFSGLVLFMLGLLQHNKYNKTGLMLPTKIISSILILITVGFSISIVNIGLSWELLTVIITGLTTLIMVLFVGFNIKNS